MKRRSFTYNCCVLGVLVVIPTGCQKSRSPPNVSDVPASRVVVREPRFFLEPPDGPAARAVSIVPRGRPWFVSGEVESDGELTGALIVVDLLLKTRTGEEAIADSDFAPLERAEAGKYSFLAEMKAIPTDWRGPFRLRAKYDVGKTKKDVSECVVPLPVE